MAITSPVSWNDKPDPLFANIGAVWRHFYRSMSNNLSVIILYKHQRMQTPRSLQIDNLFGVIDKVIVGIPIAEISSARNLKGIRFRSGSDRVLQRLIGCL